MKLRVPLMAMAAAALAAAPFVANADGYRSAGRSYAAPYSWSGFYIGAHIGGANVDTSVTSGVPGVGFFDNNAFDKFSVDDTNVFGGGTLGYNLQLGQLVIGAEGDLGFINADASAIAPDVNDGDRVRAKYGFYSVIAGRLGFTPTERILIYGKAGVAFAKIQNTGADIDAGGVFDPNFSYVVSDTRTGWAFGGGIEAALHAGWSMKVEYLRMDFEDFTARDAGGRTYHVENSADTVKIGLNYKFGRDAPMPLK